MFVFERAKILIKLKWESV